MVFQYKFMPRGCKGCKIKKNIGITRPGIKEDCIRCSSFKRIAYLRIQNIKTTKD